VSQALWEYIRLAVEVVLTVIEHVKSIVFVHTTQVKRCFGSRDDLY